MQDIITNEIYISNLHVPFSAHLCYRQDQLHVVPARLQLRKDWVHHESLLTDTDVIRTVLLDTGIRVVNQMDEPWQWRDDHCQEIAQPIDMKTNRLAVALDCGLAPFCFGFWETTIRRPLEEELQVEHIGEDSGAHAK